jgi:hypothetical protein
VSSRDILGLIGHFGYAADSSRTRGGSSAHREGEGYRPDQAGRSDELLVCAAVACRADELLARVPRPFALGRWARTYRGAKQVTDWVARLEKLEQVPAAESDSGLLVQPAWIEKSVPDLFRHQFTGPTLVRKIYGKYRPASVRFTAYSRQTEAGVARALIARLKAAGFLALRGGC